MVSTRSQSNPSRPRVRYSNNEGVVPNQTQPATAPARAPPKAKRARRSKPKAPAAASGAATAQQAIGPPAPTAANPGWSIEITAPAAPGPSTVTSAAPAAAPGTKPRRLKLTHKAASNSAASTAAPPAQAPEPPIAPEAPKTTNKRKATTTAAPKTARASKKAKKSTTSTEEASEISGPQAAPKAPKTTNKRKASTTAAPKAAKKTKTSSASKAVAKSASSEEASSEPLIEFEEPEVAPEVPKTTNKRKANTTAAPKAAKKTKTSSASKAVAKAPASAPRKIKVIGPRPPTDQSTGTASTMSGALPAAASTAGREPQWSTTQPTRKQSELPTLIEPGTLESPSKRSHSIQAGEQLYGVVEPLDVSAYKQAADAGKDVAHMTEAEERQMAAEALTSMASSGPTLMPALSSSNEITGTASSNTSAWTAGQNMKPRNQDGRTRLSIANLVRSPSPPTPEPLSRRSSLIPTAQESHVRRPHSPNLNLLMPEPVPRQQSGDTTPAAPGDEHRVDSPKTKPRTPKARPSKKRSAKNTPKAHVKN